MNQQTYWNKVSETKTFTTLLETKIINEHLTPDSFIIDYGCGYGRTLNMLWQQGYKNSVGYDFSEGMIQRGRHTFPHLQLKVSENNKIPHNDNSVDMVILFAVLTCIISDSRQASLMDEIFRVLKPGGTVYINDFLLNTDERNQNRYSTFDKKYGTYGVFELPEGAVLRHHNIKYIEKLTSNFLALKLSQITFKTMNGNLSNGLVYLGKKPE